MFGNLSNRNRNHCYGGFNYENFLRNDEMLKMGYKPPLAITTGTTVVGLLFNAGVMIATDSRATRSNLVNSNATPKICRLQRNIYCGGSGYASDLSRLTRLMEEQCAMQREATNGRILPAVCAKQVAKTLLMSAMGRMMISFVLGGVDPEGVHLYSVHFDGTTEISQYTSVGSGQYSAMGIMESRWRPDMTEDEARELIVDAVSAGIDHDLSSGSSIDLVVIRSNYTVAKCTENIHRPLVPEAKPIIETTEVKKLEDVDIYIVEELVMPLSLILPMPILQKTDKKPIRRDAVRNTPALTQITLKPRTEDIDDEDAPPKKKRKI
ncbi:proteasome subunit beta type-2 [Drosophila mojavensis]|uniref:proteasome endopeptidase complex n=1 Tax=Drosophila mojavensis TaxID=7230 RepID=B4KWA3_DROMO|nr:proteasome subunit beta type-2 [Drosophila mojavensis]EDW18510.1 uncharacterized protein Dmoj_GI12054 [Drosophila mojavensis]